MVAVYQHEQFTQKIRASMLDNAQVVASRFGSHKSQIGGVRWNRILPQASRIVGFEVVPTQIVDELSYS